VEEASMILDKFRIGIDIHGVLDHHPEKFIKLAKCILVLQNFYSTDVQVHIISGPKKETIMKELSWLCRKHNQSRPFWTEVHSIVDYIKENDIPHYYTDDGHLWTKDKSDWDRVKGKIAKDLDLDLHFDDSAEYEEHFPPGVFSHVKRRRAA
jgi:hypothetical protein